VPYRSDLEEMSDGNRYNGTPKKAKPQGFFENEVASTPWMVLFMFTTCCFPLGLIFTSIVWKRSADPVTRRRARISTLFPVGLVVICLAYLASAEIIEFLFAG